MAPRKTNPPAASTHHMKTRSQRRREQAEAEAAAKAAAEAAAEAAKQEEEEEDDDDEEEGEQDESDEVSENEDVSDNADENGDNDDEGQDNGDVENHGDDEGESDEDEINSNGKRSRSRSESPPPSPKKPRLEEGDSGESENDEEDENEDHEDQDEDQDEHQDEDKDEGKDDNKDNEGDDEMNDPDEDQDNDEPQKPNGPADEDDHMTDSEEGPQANGDENHGEDHGKIAGGPTAIDQFANNSNNSNNNDNNDSNDNDNNIVQNNAPQHTIIRDDYWPNIRPHFERLHRDYVNGSSEEHRNTEIQIPCCVCHNLTSVPFSSEHYPAGLHDHQELAAVLPCGHLIGLDCLTEWRQQADFIPLPCPYCRRPLDCEDCFVPFRVYVLNQVDVPPPTSFSANPNEGGLCNTCHSRNSFIVNTVLMPDLRPGIANPSNGLLRQWVAQEASREYREQRRIHETTSSHHAATFLNVFSTLRSEANNMQQQFMSQYPALQRLEFDANNQRPWNAPFDCPPNSNASSTSPQISNHFVDSFNSTVYTDSGNGSIDSFNSTVYPPSGVPSIDSFNSTVNPTSSDTSVPFIGYDGSTDTSSSSFFEEARWQGHTDESDSDASNGGSSSTDVQYWIDFMRRQNPH
ncbi:Replicase polyprotein 1a [Colletotrichum aenigma]|uniref:Replicase polyprotein 1a n=1 Tax=Colletotrichum aenigma TaxID=1215731 RepID=UPI0018724787|nr:Replicase polyprotein 1a [Colletotrichum aenigma]KAF5522638.1 Replicase polyprotein 1a [Colletotrichum aenigma]